MAKKTNSDVAMHDTEWDLMDVLWQKQRGTAREVADDLADKRGWAYSTVKTMLDRLVTKGLVSARQVGNVWEYTPAVQKRAAQKNAWQKFVERTFGGAMTPALHFLAKDAQLTEKQRQDLLTLLSEQKKHDK